MQLQDLYKGVSLWLAYLDAPGKADEEHGAWRMWADDKPEAAIKMIQDTVEDMMCKVRQFYIKN